jgi:hypothetical protein
MRTQWTITKDFFPDLTARPASPSNAAGIVGPRGAKLTHEEIVNHKDGKKFRLLDDDRVVMYEGVMVVGDVAEAELAPLDDFGEPNAGCTIMEVDIGRFNWQAL